MGANSKIEWTDHTMNPWRGCARVHTGCLNCYAERMSKRNPAVLGVWGPQGTRVVAAESSWREPLKWDKASSRGLQAWGLHVELCKQSGILDPIAEWKRRSGNEPIPERHRVFCASLADVFEDWQGPMVNSGGDRLFACVKCGHWGTSLLICEQCLDEDKWHLRQPVFMDDVRARLFELIDATPNLDWQLLTKRPENIVRMWKDAGPPRQATGNETSIGFDVSWFRPNVWLLTSVSDQETADAMIRPLLECRHLSPVLGLSMEPLVGPVDLLSVGWPGTDMGDRHRVDVLRFGYWCKHPHMFASPCAQIGERKGGFVNHSNMHDDYGKLSWIIVGGESGHGARPMHPQWVIDIRDQCQAAGVPFFFKQGSQANWSDFKDFDSFPGDLRVREFPTDATTLT